MTLLPRKRSVIVTLIALFVGTTPEGLAVGNSLGLAGARMTPKPGWVTCDVSQQVKMSDQPSPHLYSHVRQTVHHHNSYVMCKTYCKLVGISYAAAFPYPKRRHLWAC
jgi:hypothetical protein